MAQDEMIAVEALIHCRYTKVLPLEQIQPNPQNPIIHPPGQLEILGEVIKRQGWRQPICVSKRSGFITKGHGRYMAAKAAGLKVAPVEEQEYESEQAELADLMGDNRIAELAVTDALGLGRMLKKLNEKEQELTGYNQDEILPLLLAEYIAPKANTAVPRICETLRVTKPEKAVIVHAFQKYCLKAGKELELGEALTAICQEWEGVPVVQVNVPTAVDLTKEPAKIEAAVVQTKSEGGSTVSEVEPEISQDAPKSESESHSISFSVKFAAKTSFEGREVFSIRSTDGVKYLTEDQVIYQVANVIKDSKKKLQALVTVVGENSWIVSAEAA